MRSLLFSVLIKFLSIVVLKVLVQQSLSLSFSNSILYWLPIRRLTKSMKQFSCILSGHSGPFVVPP